MVLINILNLVVVTFSTRDTLTRLISRFNLPCRIISLINDNHTPRQLALSKGVESYEFDKTFKDRDELIQGIKDFLKINVKINVGNKILIIGKYKNSKLKEPKYTNVFEFVEN